MAQDGWYRWTPANAARSEYAGIARAVSEFESLDTDGGREAARWLREDALPDHPSTVTHILFAEERIDGYFAIASGSATLLQEDRRELQSSDPEYLPAPHQGASQVEWIARHREGSTSGETIINYALSLALRVARIQGTPLAVLDPFDHDNARMWEERYGFRRSNTPGGDDVRLWLPLF